MDSIISSFKLQKTLSPEIWDNAESNDFNTIRLKSDIRKHLLDIAKDFIDSMGVDLEIEDILFVGSLTNYNWSNYSDVDLHVVIDKSKLGTEPIVADEFFDAKKQNFNLKHDIKIKGYDVELYAQDVNETLDSKGKYSVLFNKWVETPSVSDFELDKNSVIKKVKEFNKTLTSLEKMENTKEKLDKIDAFKEKIRKYRKNGLMGGGELSNENLVFKYLRRSGFMEKLSDLKTNTTDSILSLENAELLPK
jgi:predicted component of type VI protein secretion system